METRETRNTSIHSLFSRPRVTYKKEAELIVESINKMQWQYDNEKNCASLRASDKQTEFHQLYNYLLQKSLSIYYGRRPAKKESILHVTNMDENTLNLLNAAKNLHLLNGLIKDHPQSQNTILRYILDHDELFDCYVSNIDHLRIFVCTFSSDETNQANILSHVLRPQLFSKLVDDFDAFMQLVDIFQSHHATTRIFQVFFSNQTMFNKIIDSDEILMLAIKKLPQVSISLSGADQVYKKPMLEVLTDAIKDGNEDLLKQLHAFILQQMRYQKLSFDKWKDLVEKISNEIKCVHSETMIECMSNLKSNMLTCRVPKLLDITVSFFAKELTLPSLPNHLQDEVVLRQSL